MDLSIIVGLVVFILLLLKIRAMFGGEPTVTVSVQQVPWMAQALKDNPEQVDIRCPHCEHKFDVMPGRKRKCPECKEWIWPMRPPGMKNKRLTTVEEALEWKLASAKNESSSAYALELAKQGKSFQDELRAANRDQLLEYKADGVKFVSISPAPDRCPSCRKMSKKRVNIADELRNQRLPCWDCVAEGVAPGWCRCVYIPH